MKRSKLKDLTLHITDGEHATVVDTPNGFYHLLSNKNIIDGNIQITKEDRTISKDTFDRINRRTMLDKGDVVVSTVGTIGKVAIIKEKPTFEFQRSVGIIKCNPTLLLPEYLMYYLNLSSVQNRLKALSKGAIQKCLFINDLEDFIIDYPESIEKQKEVVKSLINIDSQIERNNAMVQKLQVLAQTTYSRWFNQFEYPNADKKLAFNKELGKEIPKGWEVKHLTDIVKWESASQPPKELFKYEYQEGYIRFIQNRDYENDNHLTFIPLTKNTKLCNNTDIMMDKYGDAGCVRFGLEGAYNVALAKISALIPNTQEYIRKYLEQESTYNYLHNACIASTRASLNESLLQNLVILLPNEKVLEEFEKIQKNILHQILYIKKNNQDLVVLKEKLLPLLINGQLNI